VTPPTGAGRLGVSRSYAAHRYAVLFYALLLTLGAAPLFAALHISVNVLQFFLAFSLLAALFGVPGRRLRAVLMLLAAVAMAFRAAPPSTVGMGVATGALVVNTILALVATANAIRFALRGRIITPEHIYAALSAYLLAGVVFGVTHWTIESVLPGSYGEAGAGGVAARFSLTTALYYSFVTLATLGYGDVVPKTDVARGVAVVEAVMGQLYIAVMIAHLVGARLKTDDGDEPDGAAPGARRR
jgi:voltage-gated potassium channel